MTGINRIIYDFGSNNGDDIPYYLKKADVVIAVEANPSLCDIIRERFKREIDESRVFVENCVLDVEVDSKSIVPFYIHKYNTVQSQFPQPSRESINDFECVMIKARTPFEIIDQYGLPLYIKIDLENYDAKILRHLFEREIRPLYISAEAHHIDVFSLLSLDGEYKFFKILRGRSVRHDYRSRVIRNRHGSLETYSFPHHSAGPFGDDIAGDWMSASDAFRLLAVEKLGWIDIHATNKEGVKLGAPVRLRNVIPRLVLDRVRLRILDALALP